MFSFFSLSDAAHARRKARNTNLVVILVEPEPTQTLRNTAHPGQCVARALTVPSPICVVVVHYETTATRECTQDITLYLAAIADVKSFEFRNKKGYHRPGVGTQAQQADLLIWTVSLT